MVKEDPYLKVRRMKKSLTIILLVIFFLGYGEFVKGHISVFVMNLETSV